MGIQPSPQARAVAEEARKTYEEIRQLRKSMPSKYAWQKKELEAKIKEAQDRWWERVQPIMREADPRPVMGKED